MADNCTFDIFFNDFIRIADTHKLQDIWIFYKFGRKLTHQDIGQMDMYIRMFDDLKKQEDDNPTIGIIFCTDKDETMVKYSVLNESEQIFASKYMTVSLYSTFPILLALVCIEC